MIGLASWRRYCRRCDEFIGPAMPAGEQLPDPMEKCSCGHFPELVSGMWVKKQLIDKAREELELGKRVRQ